MENTRNELYPYSEKHKKGITFISIDNETFFQNCRSRFDKTTAGTIIPRKFVKLIIYASSLILSIYVVVEKPQCLSFDKRFGWREKTTQIEIIRIYQRASDQGRKRLIYICSSHYYCWSWTICWSFIFCTLSYKLWFSWYKLVLVYCEMDEISIVESWSHVIGNICESAKTIDVFSINSL